MRWLRPARRTQFAAASSLIIDAMSRSMPATDARKAQINVLVKGLQSAGIWDLLDVMWVLAAHSPQASLLNWKSPGTFTPSVVNSPVWQANRGYTGNGTSSRLATGWIPSTNGVNFALNNASVWSWALTDIAAAAFDIGITSDSNVNRAGINSRNATSQLSGFLNSSSNVSPVVPSSIGLSGLTRASASTITVWKNGVTVVANSIASTGLPTIESWICAQNSGSFSARQIAFGAYGASLAGRELAFYNLVLSYLQAVGAA